MKYITTVFLVSLLAFILNGCNQLAESQKIRELEKQIIELKDQKENDSFGKNKECSEYKEKVKDGILSEPGVMGIDTVFYSPKVNSCLYVIWKQPFVEKIGKYVQQYFLIDLFTNETITFYYSDSKTFGDYGKFIKTVEDYKK